MYLKVADGMANSIDPDQTAPKEQSDLGLSVLCPQTYLSHHLECLQYFNLAWSVAHCCGFRPWPVHICESQVLFMQGQIVLVHLYKSTESYCCHFDVGVGVGVTL